MSHTFLECCESGASKGQSLTDPIVQFGGQTPLKLARDLEAAGAPIIGTTPDCIDLAEDRERFQQLVDELGLKQPPNRTATESEQAVRLLEDPAYLPVMYERFVRRRDRAAALRRGAGRRRSGQRAR